MHSILILAVLVIGRQTYGFTLQSVDTLKSGSFTCMKTERKSLLTHSRGTTLYLNNRDMDNAYNFPEGEKLAKELYEHVRIREFRSKLQDFEREDLYFSQKYNTMDTMKGNGEAPRIQLLNSSLRKYINDKTSGGRLSQMDFFRAQTPLKLEKTRMRRELQQLENSIGDNSNLTQAIFVLGLSFAYLYAGIMGIAPDSDQSIQYMIEAYR